MLTELYRLRETSVRSLYYIILSCREIDRTENLNISLILHSALWELLKLHYYTEHVGKTKNYDQSISHNFFMSESSRLGLVYHYEPKYSDRQDWVWAGLYELYEPSHEIVVLFVFCKILQTHMRNHPGLIFGRTLRQFHTSCVQTEKALARLHKCAGSPEPLLVAYVISTIISWGGT